MNSNHPTIGKRQKRVSSPLDSVFIVEMIPTDDCQFSSLNFDSILIFLSRFSLKPPIEAQLRFHVYLSIFYYVGFNYYNNNFKPSEKYLIEGIPILAFRIKELSNSWSHTHSLRSPNL